MALQTLDVGIIKGFQCRLEKKENNEDVYLTLKKEKPEDKTTTVITYDFWVDSNGIIRELEYRRTLDKNLYSGKDTPLSLRWQVEIANHFAVVTSNVQPKQEIMMRYLRTGHNTFALDCLNHLRAKKRTSLEDKFKEMMQKAADFKPDIYENLHWV